MFEQVIRRGRGLQDRPVRRQVPAQHAQARGGFERIGERPDHVVVVALRARAIGRNVGPEHGAGRAQHLAQLPDHDRHTPGIGKVLHQVFARRHTVDEKRHRTAKLEILKLKINAEPPGDGEQVHHGVGRSTHRRIGENGVVEAFPGNHVRELQVFLDHFHRALAGHVGERHAPRVDGGQRRVHRQAHPHRLDKRCHGAGRAHRHAHAFRPAHPALGRHEILKRHLAGAHRFGKLPHIRSRPDIAAAPLAVQHRARAYHDRRQIDARRTHKLARRGLVATPEQDDPVHAIGPDALLHVHRKKIAKQHRGRLHLGLAQAHHRKLHREAPCLPDPTLHAFGQLAQPGIAGRELRPCVADADHRATIENMVGEALVLHPRTVNEAIPVELSIPSAISAVLGHSLLPSMTHMVSGKLHGRVTPWFIR